MSWIDIYGAVFNFDLLVHNVQHIHCILSTKFKSKTKPCRARGLTLLGCGRFEVCHTHALMYLSIIYLHVVLQLYLLRHRRLYTTLGIQHVKPSLRINTSKRTTPSLRCRCQIRKNDECPSGNVCISTTTTTSSMYTTPNSSTSSVWWVSFGPSENTEQGNFISNQRSQTSGGLRG